MSFVMASITVMCQTTTIPMPKLDSLHPVWHFFGGFLRCAAKRSGSGAGGDWMRRQRWYSVGISRTLAWWFCHFVICQKITISDFDVFPLSLFAYLLYLINNILLIILLIGDKWRGGWICLLWQNDKWLFDKMNFVILLIMSLLYKYRHCNLS